MKRIESRRFKKIKISESTRRVVAYAYLGITLVLIACNKGLFTYYAFFDVESESEPHFLFS